MDCEYNSGGCVAKALSEYTQDEADVGKVAVVTYDVREVSMVAY